MKNQNENLTEDEYARNEPPVAATEILAEIKPLLEDYFQGEIAFDEKSITYCLLNGQKFKLLAEEVV